jgi:xanthine dehydrogenase YagS FAD-binding subunit
MREFAYQRAPDLRAAIDAVARRPDAAFLGGGTNLVDHMKLGVATPDLLVDVTGIPFGGVNQRPEGGVRIGAGVRNSELAADPLIRERYPVLARALLAGASGQLRNLATTGGNLLQRTRCVYFQDVSTPCNKRSPGSGCSALSGYTRYHAILGHSEHCVAVHPSDMAVALAALEATVEVRGPEGPRDIAIADFYRLPGHAPERDTVLEHGELITGVILPELPMARRSTYLKVRDRASYAFALVSVAAAVDVSPAGLIEDLRIAFGGLAHKPWRANRAEEVLRGSAANDAAFARAAEAELRDARSLPHNAFKIPMARGALTAIMRDLTSGDAP